MTTQIRLLVADDHVLMREGLKQLFALFPDIHVAAEADNGSSVLERLRDKEIDLLLLDFTMPGICGEELIVRIRGRHPDLPILVLSMHNELQIIRRALKAGANGYVTKDKDLDCILGAIRKVAAGGRFIDPDLAEQMVFEISSGLHRADHDCLTAREFQILRLLARGTSINDIALNLAISNKTVSTHKARLMNKMGFASNADLVCYAVGKGLVERS